MALTAAGPPELGGGTRGLVVGDAHCLGCGVGPAQVDGVQAGGVGGRGGGGLGVEEEVGVYGGELRGRERRINRATVACRSTIRNARRQALSERKVKLQSPYRRYAVSDRV